MAESTWPEVLPKLPCPEGCDPAVCDAVYNIWKANYAACPTGDDVCHAEQFLLYQKALNLECGCGTGNG